MNRPTPPELRALRQRYAVPTNTPRVWQVWSCGVVVYENTSIALCWGYIRQHNLNTKPITKI